MDGVKSLSLVPRIGQTLSTLPFVASAVLIANARERILRIITRKWAGWEDEKGDTNTKGLAKLTKGYGGADLRVRRS